MRDDVKIGILLGFLVIVGVFIYWLIPTGANNKGRSALDLSGQRPATEEAAPAKPAPVGPAVVAQAPAPPAPADAGRGASAAPAPAEPVVVPPEPIRGAWDSRWDAPLPPLPEIPPAIAAPPPAAAPAVAAPAGAGVAAAGPTLAGPRPPAAHPPHPHSPGTRFYNIQKGDNAWTLAEKFYGNGSKWTLLEEANQTIDWKGGNVPIGAKIRVPPPPAATAGPAGGVTAGGPAVGPDEYVIKSGDMLGTIAREKLGKESLWPEILKVNPGLDERNLPVGKVIKLPKIAPTPAGSPTGPTTPAIGPDEYVIKSGDMLGTIAREKLGKESLWPEILKLNPGLDERNLPVGKVIKLPKIAPAPTGGGSPATDQPLGPPPGTGRSPDPIRDWL